MHIQSQSSLGEPAVEKVVSFSRDSAFPESPRPVGFCPRHPTRQMKIVWRDRSVALGGGAPVVVQSMTDTDTANATLTALQVKALALAGSELVRITVNTKEAAAAVPEIRKQLDQMGIFVPLVGDFHYNGHVLLREFPGCAENLSKYRVNPGNLGGTQRWDDNFSAMVEVAKKNEKCIRIGVNWGSLDQHLMAQMMDENANRPHPWSAPEVMMEALITSAIRSAQQAESLGLPGNAICLSTKVSKVQELVAVYRTLSERCNWPLHLGLTEAGMGSKGVVASSAALAILLQEGIGDTIRISLTPEPGGDRTKEVVVAQEILQTMGIRAFSPMVAACPGCGRTNSAFFRELADQVQRHLRQQMTVWRGKYVGVEHMQVAVMGCVVNGPGESRHADVGISLPGVAEDPVAPVFLDGQRAMTLKGPGIVEEFKTILENYVERRYKAATESIEV